MMAQTTRLQQATAEALLALRSLILEVCRARPDGAELEATVKQGTVRMVLDEREAFITFGITSAPGAPVQWLETVVCDPSDEATFGTLESLRLLAPSGGRAH